MASIIPIEQRPLQCFGCWEYGHVKNKCKSPLNRSDICYICGRKGHTPNLCERKDIRCLLCRDRGREFDHRMGSGKCTVYTEAVEERKKKRLAYL